MKKIILVTGLIGSSTAIFAQDAQTIDALKQELRELRQRTEQLEQKLKQIESAPKPAAATNAPPTAATVRDASTTATPPAWSPTAPITVFRGGGNSYMNISADTLFAAGGSTASDIELLQRGGHDPKERGFTLQAFENTFEGAIDPFFRAQANVVLQLDRKSETTIELEEAWAETTSLPGNITIRAGQMFSEFGRQNSQHAHAWTFLDSPLVSTRLLGPDALRNPGARISWLTPLPFYSELMFSVQNSGGSTADSFRSGHEGQPFLGRPARADGVRGFGDLLFVPRAVASFDLTPEQTLLGGASAAFGPNSSWPHSDTQIYGVDLFWKWKPTTHHYGFPFVTWQSEAMLRHYQAGAFSEDLNRNGILDAGDADLNNNGVIEVLPRELLKDWGFYTQLAYGFHKGWVTALRFDYIDRIHPGAYEAIYGNDAERARRWRISPNLTWYPSEFSKIRLQYNLDERAGIGPDHSVWLQFEFLLGSHGAHKF